MATTLFKKKNKQAVLIKSFEREYLLDLPDGYKYCWWCGSTFAIYQCSEMTILEFFWNSEAKRLDNFTFL